MVLVSHAISKPELSILGGGGFIWSYWLLNYIFWAFQAENKRLNPPTAPGQPPPPANPAAPIHPPSPGPTTSKFFVTTAKNATIIGVYVRRCGLAGYRNPSVYLPCCRPPPRVPSRPADPGWVHRTPGDLPVAVQRALDVHGDEVHQALREDAAQHRGVGAVAVQLDADAALPQAEGVLCDRHPGQGYFFNTGGMGVPSPTHPSPLGDPLNFPQ